MDVAHGPRRRDGDVTESFVRDVDKAADADGEVDRDRDRGQGEVKLDAIMELPHLNGGGMVREKGCYTGGATLYFCTWRVIFLFFFLLVFASRLVYI